MVTFRRPVWSLPIDDTYPVLDTRPQGLSDSEAQQRLEQFGPKELPEPPRRPLWLRFTDQLTHFMALLLWVAGIRGVYFPQCGPGLGDLGRDLD